MMRRLAALSAAVAIAAGAFGAHGVDDAQATEWLRTGGLYQLIHAVAVFSMAQDARFRRPGGLMLAGSALFAGTLYAMAMAGPRWLGAITPIGGAAMILAWLWIAVSVSRR